MNKHKTIGIDLAKSSFYLVTLSPQGKREGKTKLTRSKLFEFPGSAARVHGGHGSLCILSLLGP